MITSVHWSPTIWSVPAMAQLARESSASTRRLVDLLAGAWFRSILPSTDRRPPRL